MQPPVTTLPRPDERAPLDGAANPSLSGDERWAGPPFDNTCSIRSELLASESRRRIRVSSREQAVSLASTYD